MLIKLNKSRRQIAKMAEVNEYVFNVDENRHFCFGCDENDYVRDMTCFDYREGKKSIFTKVLGKLKMNYLLDFDDDMDLCLDTTCLIWLCGNEPAMFKEI